jgi:hypothetical protein
MRSLWMLLLLLSSTAQASEPPVGSKMTFDGRKWTRVYVPTSEVEIIVEQVDQSDDRPLERTMTGTSRLTGHAQLGRYSDGKLRCIIKLYPSAHATTLEHEMLHCNGWTHR